MAKNKDSRNKVAETGDAAAPVQETAGAEVKTEAVGEVMLSAEEFNEVKAHIESLQKELDGTVSMAQRLQADFDNYRKRNASISLESREEGIRLVAKALLPVFDNFDRALQSMEESGCADPCWYDGIRLVYRQLVEVLEKEGLERIDEEGVFDPELHEAVLQEEAEDAESGTILAVLQKGYRMKGRIIRHSMVKVAK